MINFFQYSKIKLLQVLYKLNIKAPAVFDQAVVEKGDINNIDSSVWQDFSLSLIQLKTQCIENKIQLIFVILPHMFNLKEYPFLSIHQAIAKELEAQSVKYIDLYPFFKNKNDLEFRANLLWDHHYNFQANTPASNEIANLVQIIISEI